MDGMYTNYHNTRLKPNRSRDVVWVELVSYLKSYISRGHVLELGSGYCSFINKVKGKKRYALDKYIDPKRFAAEGVVSLYGDHLLIKKQIPSESIDTVFASNFFEHLTDEELENYFISFVPKMKRGASLIILQPNYRLCVKNYFDDYTHKKVWTDVSLCDYLSSKGLKITRCDAGFLPLSLKSRLPKWRFLIWLYVRMPLKPLAAQMLIVAKKL